MSSVLAEVKSNFKLIFVKINKWSGNRTKYEISYDNIEELAEKAYEHYSWHLCDLMSEWDIEEELMSTEEILAQIGVEAIKQKIKEKQTPEKMRAICELISDQRVELYISILDPKTEEFEEFNEE
jgi:hypothetical protein